MTCVSLQPEQCEVTFHAVNLPDLNPTKILATGVNTIKTILNSGHSQPSVNDVDVFRTITDQEVSHIERTLCRDVCTLHLAVLTQHQLVTDGQTQGHSIHNIAIALCAVKKFD